MVLDSIISYIRAEKRPAEMLPFGFIAGSIAIILAIWVFRSNASFAMVTFTVMAALPLMVHVMKFEKENLQKKGWRIQLHGKAVKIFLFLFLGFILAYTFWFLLLPIGPANNLFSLQINAITNINVPTGAVISSQSPFFHILLNNLRVLGISLLFSFIFGSGALFILTWNASVIGVAIAMAIKVGIAAGGSNSASYFAAFSFGIIRFLTHGIPEVLSYFIAGLAGAIISFTLLDYRIGKRKSIKKATNSLRNSSLLLVLSIGLLIVATVIEILITPLLIR